MVRLKIILMALLVLVGLGNPNVYAQEMWSGVNITLYQQNKHLDDGAGYVLDLNYKLDKYPVFVRFGFTEFLTLGIPRTLASENRVNCLMFEPALLVRWNPNNIFMPYAGVGYGVSWFTTKLSGGDTTIWNTDKFSLSGAPTLILGVDIVASPRVSCNFNYRAAVYNPTITRTTNDLALHTVLEDKGKIKLETAFISIGLTIHIIKHPFYRNMPKSKGY